MKEAIVVDLNGFYKEPVLVDDAENGVFEITEMQAQEGTDANGDPLDPISVVVGYRISVKVPEGLYTPKWDSSAEMWIEGKPQSEIDAVKNQPQKPSVEQQLSDLQDAFNAFLMG